MEFNTYYNQFILLTKIDIRCYDAMTGKLRKVFNEVYDDKFSVDLCKKNCFFIKNRFIFIESKVAFVLEEVTESFT